MEFVEAKGGREIANLALVRATEVYLKVLVSIGRIDLSGSLIVS